MKVYIKVIKGKFHTLLTSITDEGKESALCSYFFTPRKKSPWKMGRTGWQREKSDLCQDFNPVCPVHSQLLC
jgi:hypothetical protein